MQNEGRLVPYHSTDLTGRRVLVLAPHPDDETFGCGGSMILHRDAGDPVKVVFLTNGAMGDISNQSDKETYVALRKKEAEKACANLGVMDLEFWPYEDRSLASSSGVLKQMIDLLEDFLPELVYVPSLVELHPDHRAAASLLLNAVRNLMIDFDLAFYEVGQPLSVNTLVDITSVLDRKCKTFDEYKSQLLERPYADICNALNRFRSLTLPDKVTHAEGFSLWKTDTIKKLNTFSIIYHDINRFLPGPSDCQADYGDVAVSLPANDLSAVSIIVRTYNRPELLKEALLSISQQTHGNIECVVVNDGGVDVSQVVDQFKTTMMINYIAHDLQMGRSVAANTGLANITGAWVMFLDDDDLFFPEAVKVLLAEANKSGASVVYGQVICKKYDKNHMLDKDHAPMLFAKPFDSELLLCCNYIPFNALLIKKTAFEKVGNIDQTLDLFEDWDLLIRFAEQYRFSYIPELVSEYRSFENSTVIGGRFKEEQINMAYNRIVGKNWDVLNPAVIKKYADYMVELHAFSNEKKIENITREFNKQIDELEEKIAVRDELLSVREKQIYELEGNIAIRNEWLGSREQQIDALKAEVNSLINSTSWKITKPIRFLKRSFQTLINIATYKAFVRSLPLPETVRSLLRKYYYDLQAGANRRKKIITTGAKSNLFVSIIIPVYNHADYIHKCISTALNQTYDNIEVIVVNDSSTDSKVEDILSEFVNCKKCKIIHNRVNSGISETQNRGLFAAKGDLIAFLDCDDYLALDAVQSVVDLWSPETVYAYSDRIYIDSQNKEVSKVSFIELPKEDMLVEQLDGKMYASHLKVIHRRVFEKVGLFDSVFDAAQDYEFLMRAAFHFPSSSFLHVPHFIYYHRWHDNQQTITGKKKQDIAIKKASNQAKFRMAVRNGDYHKKVSFLVLSYGKEDQTLNCIKAIKKTVKIPHEIILLDNGSKKETVDFIKEHIEGIENVRVCYESENHGPAKGRLKAMQYVSCDYVISLDNDIEVCQGWLEEILLRADESDDIGAVCCRVTFPNHTLQFSGGWLKTTGIRVKLGLFDQGKNVFDLTAMRMRECDWVPIGATLYKTDFPVDPKYPNVFEDIAVSSALKAKGKRMVNSPASLAIHHHIMFDRVRSQKEKEYLEFRYKPELMLKCIKRYYEQYNLVIDDDYVFSVNNLKGASDDEIIAALARL
ncbi:MAG: glycosyltransferase [Desulfobacula sp.]|jgi:glycosyltransferase involved in cell wall biosynthesis/LmbE family N-acetylglucosaminyl deacetylase|uniref:glycosyltransferase n=1 Tax=Desulfobacula sp. TaxID=2593537 RepID=UPI001D2050CA|nr:glycosyltransferase [Desulfobacula sp.]MBT6339808.1 glycosyltransferase [Desulfobacula sp.]